MTSGTDRSGNDSSVVDGSGIDGSGIDGSGIDHALIAAARAVVDAQGDGLIHTVGAAVRDDASHIHVGVNLYHFTGGPCAELVALAAARTAGARGLRTIVAVGDDGRGVLSPCGRDRQVLADYHPDIMVLVPTPAGLVSVKATELLPHSYRWQDQGVQRLRFRASHLNAVRAGTKQVTMRYDDPVHVGPTLLVFESDPEVSLPGRITATVTRRISELTEAEAQSDGFGSRADVLPMLRDYYPDLQPDSEMVIVTFEVGEPADENSRGDG